VRAVFGAYGIAVDPRHLGLIADYMMHQARFAYHSLEPWSSGTKHPRKGSQAEESPSSGACARQKLAECSPQASLVRYCILRKEPGGSVPTVSRRLHARHR